MTKIYRMVAGACGAGALVMSAAGAASAADRDGESWQEFLPRQCGVSFSLMLPSYSDCHRSTSVHVDNRRDDHSLAFRQDIMRSVIGGSNFNDLDGRRRR